MGPVTTWGQWHAPSGFIGPDVIATLAHRVQWLRNDVLEGHAVANYMNECDGAALAARDSWCRWPFDGYLFNVVASLDSGRVLVSRRRSARPRALVFRANRAERDAGLDVGGALESDGVPPAGFGIADVLIDGNAFGGGGGGVRVAPGSRASRTETPGRQANARRAACVCVCGTRSKHHARAVGSRSPVRRVSTSE